MPFNLVFHQHIKLLPIVLPGLPEWDLWKGHETKRRFIAVLCFMKRFLILGLPIVIAGCDEIHINRGHNIGGPRIQGNGKPKEESRTVAEYDKVIVGSSFEVVASEGSLAPLKISADSNILHQIKTEVKDRVLKVWIEGNITTSSPLKLALSTPKINDLEASGAAKVNLSLQSKHNLKLGGSGASDIDVKGEVNNLECNLSGASKAVLATQSLTALNTTLSGASSLDFKGSVDSLDAELSGASSIKGGMHGNRAKVRMSGASTSYLGKFTNVDKESSGGSSVSFAGDE